MALFTLCFMVLATAHVALYLRGEQHLYVHEHRNYWIAYWKSGIQFTLSFVDWANTLKESIWASDYNSLPAALLLPFSLFMGYDRFGYSSIYVAYQRPAIEHFRDLWSQFGGLYLLLAVVGQAFLLNTPSKRADVVFINANIVLLFFLFTRTQGFGIHHYLPLVFWIYLLMCLGLWQLLSLTSTAPRCAAIALLAVSVLIMISSFYRTNLGAKPGGEVLPRTAYNNQVGTSRPTSVLPLN